MAQVKGNVSLSGEALNLSCGGRDGEGHVVNLGRKERAEEDFLGTSVIGRI